MENYPSPDLPGYEPPPCPDCGSTNIHVTPIDATGLDGRPAWLPGSHSCRDCHNLQR